MRFVIMGLSLLLALLLVSDTALARARADRHQQRLRPDGRHAARLHVTSQRRYARVHRRSHAVRSADRRARRLAWRDVPAPGGELIYRSDLWQQNADFSRADHFTRGEHDWWADREPQPSARRSASGRINIDLAGMIARHAQMNGVPEALVRRVVLRESGGNPHAVGRGGAMGLMQIKTATARAMGYSGSAAGLLDAETNLTYAVRYLAGAYRVAGGNADRAVSNYARGYYAAAKARGFSPYGAPYGRPGWNSYASY
jgi:soluble lytic murein transglycosylase-like protein